MRILALLRSAKLALALCVALALHAAVGTPFTAGKAAELLRERFGEGVLPFARLVGLVDTYASPLFLAVAALLTLNLALCTWHRATAARRRPGRLSRRLILDVLMHLSLIVALAGGAAKGALGFVATQYLFLETPVTTASLDGVGPEVPLGFGLLLKERVLEHYPLVLQIGVRDVRTGAALALLTIREGRGAALAAGGLRLEVTGSSLEGHRVAVRAAAPGREEELWLETIPGGRTTARFGDQEVVLVAWRRDLKSVRGKVAIIEGGREVRTAWLGPNGRIGHRGTSIFLTAWGEDRFTNPYLGVQITRDPGAPLFWAGAALLAVTLPLFIAVRHAGGAAHGGGVG